jgi:hypothetical protein
LEFEEIDQLPSTPGRIELSKSLLKAGEERKQAPKTTGSPRFNEEPAPVKKTKREMDALPFTGSGVEGDSKILATSNPRPDDSDSK